MDRFQDGNGRLTEAQRRPKAGRADARRRLELLAAQAAVPVQVGLGKQRLRQAQPLAIATTPHRCHFPLSLLLAFLEDVPQQRLELTCASS
jgi:hypothetical protein